MKHIMFIILAAVTVMCLALQAVTSNLSCWDRDDRGKMNAAS